MAKKKEQPQDEGAPAWMATFSDLMNLLLCFFVLLFASSSVDEGKIQKIAASFEKISYGIFESRSATILQGTGIDAGMVQLAAAATMIDDVNGGLEGKEENDRNESEATVTDAEKLSNDEVKEEFDKRGEEQSEEMYNEIVELAEGYQVDDRIDMDYNSRYVVLNLSGAILFDNASANVREDSKFFLQKISNILLKYKYSIIEIEGHTDNLPISTSEFSNNRELSAERARNVYEYFITQGDFIDANMKIAGYGESRPIATNETTEGKAKNRRVTIKIYNQQSSDY